MNIKDIRKQNPEQKIYLIEKELLKGATMINAISGIIKNW